MNRLTAILLIAVALISGLGTWKVVHDHWALKYSQLETQIAQGERDQARQDLSLIAAHQDRADKAEQAVIDLTAKLKTARAKARADFEAALKGDPSCAAQASEPLLCPYSWGPAAGPP